MTNYMEAINTYFETCKAETVEMMIKNKNQLYAAREEQYIDCEYGKTYLLNYRPFTTLVNRKQRGISIKGEYIVYYTKQDDLILTEEQESWFEKVNASRKITHQICNRYPNKLVRLILDGRNKDEYIKGVDAYYELVKENLIERVELKGGKIKDAVYITVRLNELNGDFECENGNVRLNTIFAGGYNIQCLHVRSLVKLLKK